MLYPIMVTARSSAVSVGLACALIAPGAHAAGPLGTNGADIRTSRYGVDLHQGPVLASTRTTALGGAYAALAQGSEGIAINPAAPAVRAPWSIDSFDFDAGLGLTFPSTISGQDFFNTGRTTDVRTGGDFVFVNPALTLQFGPWGFGLNVMAQTYEVRQSNAGDQSTSLQAQFAEIDLVLARRLGSGDWVFGAGLRSFAMNVNRFGPDLNQDGEELFVVSGLSPQVGVIYMPQGRPFRVGASFRGAVPTDLDRSIVEEDTNGDFIVGDPTSADALWLPRELTLPWEANLGLALQFGPRPLNPRWDDPDEVTEELARFLRWRQRERARRARAARRQAKSQAEIEAIDAELDHADAVDQQHLQQARERVRARLLTRARALSRRYLLVSMALKVTGPVKDSVGVESFLARSVDRSGRAVVLSPRLGIEAEAVPNWLKLRIGTYGEPTRSQFGADRLHGTLGFDTKLVPWTVFGVLEEDSWIRAGAALDAARDYFGWGVSAGVWH